MNPTGPVIDGDGTARRSTVDGNEAVASVAYRTNEVIAIYPITPASPMGELADAWSAAGRSNLWGDVPEVVEMQSEAGAAGVVHGALQGGSLATTFTASQGLLLMLPNMYKIAGELTPFVMHVAARTVATHALSIFADHSDVMAARATGFALLASGSVQEAHDFAVVAQAATLRSRVPVLHFFDGFRTSHEINTIEWNSDDVLSAMLDEKAIAEHRGRGLTPDAPVLRGTAQNPDTFFQAREACNPFYEACPGILQQSFDRFAQLTGRSYHLFDYFGHPEAERVVLLMGSGAETVHEVVEAMNESGKRVGVLRVRLFRPFAVADFVRALPPTVRRVAVLDRTKEPGAVGDPLYLEVVAALWESQGSEDRAHWTTLPEVVAGRYGLSSKELHPGSVRAVFAELAAEAARRHFTIGIVDDVGHGSLLIDETLAQIEPAGRTRAIFFGLGSDGTVSANKSTIKIIGERTGQAAQGYFVYDSKKAGSVTISHLRFGRGPIRSTYLIQRADFVACHQMQLLDRLEILELAAPGATVLLNAPYHPDEVWDRLPREVQQQILDKSLEIYSVDARALATEVGLGGRINTIMQSCFFALTDLLPREEALEAMREGIRDTYGKRGSALVERNFKAIELAVERLERVVVPEKVSSSRQRPPLVSPEAPEFVQRVTAVMLAGKGDRLPVSAFPVDGTWPTGTARWEKRAIAAAIPIWDSEVCIQCNQCVLACPHAAIRAKVYASEELASAPEGFVSTPYRAPDLRGRIYTLQVAPEDCTGCHLCVEVCPAKDRQNPRRKAINMEPAVEHRDRERIHFDFFLQLPELHQSELRRIDAKGSQFLQPLMEFSGACAGCGETPYIKLLTQLFGDRLLIANATGCSSIYGGNLPTTPYTTNLEGRGPAWSNSLFEDNAEFGLGLRLSTDSNQRMARRLLKQLAGSVGEELAAEILGADARDPSGVEAQRERVARLRQALDGVGGLDADRLRQLADDLVDRSVWLVGGDGWAYDIGFGGLDHVLSQRHNVNILVLDTQVYSNTGGQKSKATPLGAAAKFASAGKDIPRKDLGLEAMSYGHAYVAQIAFGAKMNHTVEVLREAEAFPGPSLVIAFSPCIAHGYDLSLGAVEQQRMVDSGLWPLFRFDPRRAEEGQPPFRLDCKPPSVGVGSIFDNETRFRIVERSDPDRFRELSARAQKDVERRFRVYQQRAGITTEEEPS
ncbi:MAG: pyruvate:ferredoxin (flavodoxin) oxidoreductase [Thermoanaerobaculia bacterium]|nr:pyruvate:ferredoxin (flavodoxin) oxidoreductase [Thermoanaerobaculia bacterium]